MSRLQGRVALITGAAGGLGRATALAMAAEGARLVLTDRDEDGLRETAALTTRAGSESVAMAGDVAAPETHQALVEMAQRAFGRLDILCNVAGVLGAGAVGNTSAAQFERVMRINCMAQFLAAQAAVPLLRQSPCAAIVNVASVGALVALPMMSAYCASKAAVVGLTRALAAELAPAIRCNAVCPGGIDTPMARNLLASVPPEDRPELLARLTGRQLLKRFATPEEMAATLVFLASDDARFLTGSVIAADAGHSAS
ncbi:SDR family oxidoreductase [Ramlibacter sp. AW1]|uniref:SDR family oxidoreductase n=1 Tax=Ramlibacter aurantiacus TaxID=2801330 RepID=A0A937D9M9_9BURK|nr:SDR family oxidoreductase [Ramlibacter aurantiacus]MBL0423351.1 SDR family oxidoreductase [Ramlibacter aurantiacus]